jgi:hypothetical protein
MNNLNALVGVMMVVVLLVVAGLLIVRVGGVAIRSASLTYEIGTLELASNKLLPGVPVTVGVGEEIFSGGRSSALLLRLPTGSVAVGDVDLGELETGSFRAVVPCDSAGRQGKGVAVRLVLVDHATQAVLAQSEQLTLLPSGPDCLFAQ